MKRFPFRLGTTSYILPDDILPNVRYLAGKVDDVELVLFEVDDGPNNLPDEKIIHELNLLASENDLTYTVHFPLDLSLGVDGDEQHTSLLKARKVIEHTKALDPFAYVLHLDGRNVQFGADEEAVLKWNHQSERALTLVADWVGDAKRLAVENLEGYALDFWDKALTRVPAGRCIDIGHLWRDGHDPLPFLGQHLHRARVLHIHGIGERDHKSLAMMPMEELVRVFGYLLHSGFQGVLTVEVFGVDDFQSSMAAIQAAIQHFRAEELWENT